MLRLSRNKNTGMRNMKSQLMQSSRTLRLKLLFFKRNTQLNYKKV